MTCEDPGGVAGADRAGGVAQWLRLAASPAFAAMALLNGLAGPDPMAGMCGGASLLGGMAPMYLLMSAVHAGPWLGLLAGAARRNPSKRPS